MRITSAEFARSAVERAEFPSDGLPEIALLGRSNVGKSSLINSLAGRKSLARTSSTPGKTQTINFYRINNEFYLVDLPGYGYAKVPGPVKRTWERMINDYMEKRRTLRGAIVIIDPRRDPGDLEEFVYKWLVEIGVPHVTVFTKSDKLSRNQLNNRVSAWKKDMPLKDPVTFSALTGTGKTELGKKLLTLLHAPEARDAHGGDTGGNFL